MLHAKCQDHRFYGPGEEDLKRSRTIYERGCHLGLVPFIQTFVLIPKEALHENLALIGQAVSEKEMFEHCGR